jgi:hypothetical protein
MMKALKDFFDSQDHESAQAVQELEAHVATWPAVQQEVTRRDGKCIELARELAPLQLAGSPRALEVEVALKKARMERDGVRWTFQRIRQELENRAESYTRVLINDFHLDSLERARELSKFYRFARVDTYRNPFTESKRVTIRHNSAALDAGKELIFAGIKEIAGMHLQPLAKVKARIAELEAEFSALRFTTMETEEVPESVAADMKPTSPAVAAYQENFANLSGRISALERGK